MAAGFDKIPPDEGSANNPLGDSADACPPPAEEHGASEAASRVEPVGASSLEERGSVPPVARTVIPVAADSLTVDRRVVETGRGVRIVKTVSEREQVVDEPLALDEVHVERTEVNRWLEESEIPGLRQEGDVTVVPVLEEVLVTTKRLLLKEEIRITRVRREVHQPQRVVLRSEQVSVEHFDESKDPTDPADKSD
jgi:uncharacterized protein (TIGR02271 family)